MLRSHIVLPATRGRLHRSVLYIERTPVVKYSGRQVECREAPVRASGAAGGVDHRGGQVDQLGWRDPGSPRSIRRRRSCRSSGAPSGCPWLARSERVVQRRLGDRGIRQICAGRCRSSSAGPRRRRRRCGRVWMPVDELRIGGVQQGDHGACSFMDDRVDQFRFVLIRVGVRRRPLALSREVRPPTIRQHTRSHTYPERFTRS